MTMENIYKQFEALGTEWRRNLLLRARVQLTLAYTGVSALLLSVFSYLLYGALLRRITESIDEQVLNSLARHMFLERAAHALLSQILTADAIALVFVVVCGYFLTSITLWPIQQARAREQRFLADAAHELRMPLAVMKTGAEVALRGEAGHSPKIKKLLTDTVDEIDALTRIANGLLSLVGGGNSKQNARSLVSLQEILRNVVHKLQLLAKERDVILSFDTQESTEKIQVYADTDALTRAFENIVENGIKYSHSGGTVAMRLSRSGTSALIQVTDTGIGISPADVLRVTEAFYRADSARTAQNGSGLGLSIVSETVQAHGGALTIESELGVGTTVNVTLPLVAA